MIELSKNARLYIGGQELTDIKSQDLKNRLTDGMKCLVEQVYTNLKMLTIDYDDAMLKTIINSSTSGTMFGTLEDDVCSMEIFNEIAKQKRLAVRTKIKDLIDVFRGGSYGWYETAILCIIAKLYKMEKISFRYNGAPVADRDIYTALTNSNQQQNTIVDIEETITTSQITKLKGLYKEFFNDESCVAISAKDVHNAFIERMKREVEDLGAIAGCNRFEFVKPLDNVVSSLRSIASMVYPGLYQSISKLGNALDDKLDIADEIASFIRGSQFKIFEKIETLKKGNQANLSYVSQENIEILNRIYESRQPWREMTKANEALTVIAEEIKQLQNEAREEVLAKINEKLVSLKSIPTFAEISESLRSQITLFFTALENKAKEERYIGNLKAMHTDIDNAYNNSLKSINKWIEEEANKKASPTAQDDTSKTQTQKADAPKRPMKQFVQKAKAMDVSFSKPMLENEADVEAYISELKKKMMDYIRQNKNIMLN